MTRQERHSSRNPNVHRFCYSTSLACLIFVFFAPPLLYDVAFFRAPMSVLQEVATSELKDAVASSTLSNSATGSSASSIGWGVSPELVPPKDLPSLNNANKTNKYGKDFDKKIKDSWKDHRFVFIGGLHFCGTSVLERLLSTQRPPKGVSGLRIDNTSILDRSACMKPSHKEPDKCLSSENEGVFVTKEFLKLYVRRNTICVGHPATRWGDCALPLHLTERDVVPHLLDGGVDAFRSRLYRDWSFFWDVRANLLVEKDIPNVSRSRFLQNIFTAERTAFVFTMRHPMSSCKHFDCKDVRGHVRAWIDAYNVLLEDVKYLKRYIIIHGEGLTTPGKPIHVIRALETLLGWKRGQLNYTDHTMHAIEPDPVKRPGGHYTITIDKASNTATETMKDKPKLPSVSSPPAEITKLGSGLNDSSSSSNTLSSQLTLTSNKNSTSSSLKVDSPSLPSSVSPHLAPNNNNNNNNVHRRLGFHQDGHPTPHSHHTHEVEHVVLRRSYQSQQWEEKYPIVIKHKANVAHWKALQEMEKELAVFCYSITSLAPLKSCISKNSYIYKKSSSTF